MLGDGNHELSIVAVDLAGNHSAPAVVDWLMDQTAPALAWGSMSPSAASVLNSTSFQAVVQSTEPVTLSCSVNGFDLNQGSSPIVLNNLTEGNYSLSVSGRDAAGNASNSLSHQFAVDLTPPTVTITSEVTSVSNQNSNQFDLTASENASFECSLDHAGFALCASPVTVSGLAEGDHIFEVRATDLAGNTGPVAKSEWIVDTTPPSVTTLSVVVSRTSVTVNWTTSEAATSIVYWGAGVVTPNTTPEETTLVTSHNVVLSGLTPNTVYTVIVGGYDKASNGYTSAKKQFRTSP
jgi:hypothetical protein